LEDIFLGPRELSTIGVLVPGVTVNEIREGVIAKKKIVGVRQVTGIGHCPNPACVMNHDAEAALYPHFHVYGEDRSVLSCHYCEQYFNRDEVLA
jgi:aspartate carbamoyltransferase regulatory subunit